jgi:hypothetical protein
VELRIIWKEAWKEVGIGAAAEMLIWALMKGEGD